MKDLEEKKVSRLKYITKIKELKSTMKCLIQCGSNVDRFVSE